MPILHSYGLNFKNNMEYNHITSSEINYNLHIHNACEIYFPISEGVNYFVEKAVYSMEYGDLIITNNQEVHKPIFLSNKMYERIYILFEPIVAQRMSTQEFDLMDCFINRPVGEQNKISLDKKQVEEIRKYFDKIDYADQNPADGGDVLRFSYFAELLVFINRVFKNVKPNNECFNLPKKLMPVLDYINNNLETDLSLEFLEHHFYINRFYLSRLFKDNTGINIHDYIIVKRIAHAKKLLSDGMCATEACISSGFSDYSNFVKIFKKTVGLTPREYKKSILNA